MNNGAKRGRKRKRSEDRDDDSDDSAGENLSKRKSHNIAEKRRRDKINDKLQKLRSFLPNDESSPSSKAEILQKTVELIKQLELERKQLWERNNELLAEKAFLATLRSQLIANQGETECKPTNIGSSASQEHESSSPAYAESQGIAAGPSSSETLDSTPHRVSPNTSQPNNQQPGPTQQRTPTITVLSAPDSPQVPETSGEVAKSSNVWLSPSPAASASIMPVKQENNQSPTYSRTLISPAALTSVGHFFTPNQYLMHQQHPQVSFLQPTLFSGHPSVVTSPTTTVSPAKAERQPNQNPQMAPSQSNQQEDQTQPEKSNSVGLSIMGDDLIVQTEKKPNKQIPKASRSGSPAPLSPGSLVDPTAIGSFQQGAQPPQSQQTVVVTPIITTTPAQTCTQQDQHYTSGGLFSFGALGASGDSTASSRFLQVPGFSTSLSPSPPRSPIYHYPRSPSGLLGYPTGGTPPLSPNAVPLSPTQSAFSIGEGYIENYSFGPSLGLRSTGLCPSPSLSGDDQIPPAPSAFSRTKPNSSSTNITVPTATSSVQTSSLQDPLNCPNR